MYPNDSFQDHLTWLVFHLKDLTWSKAQTLWSCQIKSMNFGGFHCRKLHILLKTADFLPKSMVFDENCIFWPKTVDFAVSVWFLSLKLENCWLVLSPEWLRGVSTCSEVGSLKFDSWTGQVWFLNWYTVRGVFCKLTFWSPKCAHFLPLWGS